MVAAMRRLKEEFLLSLEEIDRKIREESERVPEPQEEEDEESVQTSESPTEAAQTFAEAMQTFAQTPVQTFAFEDGIFGTSQNTREAQKGKKTPSGADPPTLFRDKAPL
jgi:hypothetical protein